MTQAGTVTISIDEFDNLREFKKVAHDGAMVIGDSGYYKWYSKDESITILTSIADREAKATKSYEDYAKTIVKEKEALSKEIKELRLISDNRLTTLLSLKQIKLWMLFTRNGISKVNELLNNIK